MSEKSVQISVRVSDRDAQFLSGLQIEDATTPSEKMRALLRQARLQREGMQDYATELEYLSGMHRPAELRRLDAERALGMRSDLLRIVSGWVVECDAFMLSTAPGGASAGTEGPQEHDDVRASLLALEAGTVERVFSLIDQVLRLGVTPTCVGYNPVAIRENLQSQLELIRVIMSTQNGEAKEQAND